MALPFGCLRFSQRHAQELFFLTPENSNRDSLERFRVFNQIVFQLAGRLNPVIIHGKKHVTFFEAGASSRVRGFFHGHVPSVVEFDGRELQAEF